MSRRYASILPVASLAIGVVLGVLLDRRGPLVSAEATKSAPTPAPREAQARAVGEDASYEQLARQYEQFAPINRTFELVSKIVSPAVVHIVASKTSRSDEPPRVRHFEETGSGVIVRGDRGRELYVLTNNHVVEGAKPEKINIFLQDGRALRPDRVWLDAKADIGVLSLGREDLPAARLGDSDDAQVGTWVLAMGSPFGLTHSVSQGIISARGRHMDELQDVENQDFLQTDAAINPGNSGGPLVNMKGEIVGINNSIASNGGGNEGVGFSIPINLARWIMAQLIAQGRVSRGALGIDLHPEFRPEDAVALGLERPRGAWINVVHPASPAAVGGLHNDDVITRFRGTEIYDLNHLINMVSMAPIGQPAEVIVFRGGKYYTLNVTVAERERTIAQMRPQGERTTTQGLLRRPDRPPQPKVTQDGVVLTTIDEALARRLGLPGDSRGVVVTQVDPGSQLAQVVKPNDVIISIDEHAVKTAEEAARALHPTPLTVEFDRVVKGIIERRSVRVP